MINVRFLFVVIIIAITPIYVYARHISKPTVFIFDHIPPYVKSFSPFSGVEYTDERPQISVFDNFYKYEFNPKRSANDTFSLYAQNNKNVILIFFYSPYREPLNYVITKDDTITFSFIDGIPYAKSKVPMRNDCLNYERKRLMTREDSQQKTMYEIYEHPILAIQKKQDLDKIFQIPQIYYNSARNFLSHELLFLNNSKWLRDQSPETYNFFVDKFTYQIASLDFQQNRLKTDSVNALLAYKKEDKNNSSYSYFLPFLENIAHHIIFEKAKVIKSANGSDLDYRDIYDRTSTWIAINDFYRKQLLYEYLKEIGTNFSIADLQKYLAKFAYFSNDTLLVGNIKNEFFINDKFNDDDSLYLIDTRSNKKSFQGILNANKGKVIYIDFWASWCAPCRMEMKSAGKLRDNFKNKEIAFVYIYR